MTPEQGRRVRDLFEAALDRDPATVVAWIGREAADDPAVRAEVLSLLEHHSRAGAFLSQPAAEQAIELLLDDEPLAPGAVVGAYTIVREIGRGGMGRVYLASDAKLGRTVALKALAPHLLRDPLQRERLRARSARGGGAHASRHLHRLRARGDRRRALHRQPSSSTATRSARKSGRRGVRRATTIMRTARELAAALASAHEKGIVHRDLKPENVMRATRRRLKILDFGLARIGGGGRRRAAPDAAGHADRHAGLHGARADQRPAGRRARRRLRARRAALRIRVRRASVRGDRPRWRRSRACWRATRVRSARGPRCRAASPSLIARCMQKAPADRFGSAAELLGALDAVDVDAAAGRRTSPGGARTRSSSALLYIAAAVCAWQIKEWVETPVTVAIFLALGAAATIGGVLRGHLVFTSLMNRALARARATAHWRRDACCSTADRGPAVRRRGADRRDRRAAGGVRARARRSASRSRRSCSSRRRPPPRSERNHDRD